MLALAFVLIAGWLLGSIIGTWAYFAGSPEIKVSPFTNYKKQVYKTLKQERDSWLKVNRPRQKNVGVINSFSSNF